MKSLVSKSYLPYKVPPVPSVTLGDEFLWSQATLIASLQVTLIACSCRSSLKMARQVLAFVCQRQVPSLRLYLSVFLLAIVVYVQLASISQLSPYLSNLIVALPTYNFVSKQVNKIAFRWRNNKVKTVISDNSFTRRRKRLLTASFRQTSWSCSNFCRSVSSNKRLLAFSSLHWSCAASDFVFTSTQRLSWTTSLPLYL